MIEFLFFTTIINKTFFLKPCWLSAGRTRYADLNRPEHGNILHVVPAEASPRLLFVSATAGKLRRWQSSQSDHSILESRSLKGGAAVPELLLYWKTATGLIYFTLTGTSHLLHLTNLDRNYITVFGVLTLLYCTLWCSVTGWRRLGCQINSLSAYEEKRLYLRC